MRIRVVGIALILIATGCGGEAEPTTTVPLVTTTTAGVASSTTTTATSPTTTATAAPAPTVAPTTTTEVVETTTTTTLPPSVCPASAAIAPGALLFGGASGDFDGDGNSDELMTYQSGADDWRVRIVFSDGGGADSAIADGVDFAPPQPIGGYDIDGDGVDEAFLTVGSGASTVMVGFFAVSSCVATRITTGGTPATFGVGGSVGAVSGLHCPGDGTINRIFAQYLADDEYEGGFEPFTLSGSVLTPGIGDGAGFTAEEAFALANLDCGSLTLP